MSHNKYAYILLFVLLGVAVFLLLSSDSSNTETSQEADDTFHQDEYTIPSKYENIKIKAHEEQEEDRRYLLHASWPATENELINSDLESIAQDFISEYRAAAEDIKISRAKYIEETGSDGATFHANYGLHFDVSFANEDYLAFVFNEYRNTGNTGSETVSSVIYDRQTGNRIPMENLFVDENYLTKLSGLVRAELYEMIEEEAVETDFESGAEREVWVESLKHDMVDPGTMPTKESFHGLVLNEEGFLEVNFDKYQVLPGYWGVVTVRIPLEDISDLFVSEVRELFNLESLEEESDNNLSQSPESQLENKASAESGEEMDCSLEKCIALTFDDGPSLYTDGLLQILQEKGAKATFFVLGVNARIQQQTLLALSKAGMEIGNHTWSHKDLTKLSVDDIKREISDAADLVERVTGKRPYLVRPPYGATSGHVEAVSNAPFILWNVDTEDWKYRDPSHVSEHIISHAKPGAIVLMHDIHESTVDSMPAVIEALQGQGYKLVTVSDLIGRDNLQVGKVYRSGR